MRVAQAEAFERLLDVDAQPGDGEGVAVERRERRAVLGHRVHDGALVGDDEIEVGVAALAVRADPEHDADLAFRIVERKPVALAPQRPRVRTRRVPAVVLGGRHVLGGGHVHVS